MATLSLVSVLSESALRRPDNVAIRFLGKSTTYAELWEQVRRTATVLAERGVGAGDRVAMLLPNVPAFPVTYYAAQFLGAVAVPVHALLKAEEIEYVLRDSGAKVLVCAAVLLGEGAKGAELAGVPVLGVMDGGDAAVDRLDLLAAAAEPASLPAQRDPMDVAVILYTSGTTGKPKGAMLAHISLVMNVETAITESFEIREDDVTIACLPLFHTFGQTVVMNCAFRVGATMVIMPRFDGPGALDLLIQEKVTQFVGVPTMYIALLEAAKKDERRPNLRSALSGGSAMPLAVLEKFEEVFQVRVLEGYGLTETSPVATFNQKNWPTKPGTIGRPIWGVDADIAAADVEGRIELLPTGELGEIVVRGHCVMLGYLNRPEDTAAVMVDGWFRTGDLGTRDEDGYLTIVDRKKDMVLRGGYNVYPREVEEVLLRCPGVAQVAVVGVPHETHGEEVAAVVVREEGHDVTADDVRAYGKAHLAAYKYARRIEFVDALPLGPSGKVLKRELVAQYGKA
jgi:long-chain acyl-CoA synthetase